MRRRTVLGAILAAAAAAIAAAAWLARELTDLSP